jgi:uncharacterized protein YndB with AHSA1/START domain
METVPERNPSVTAKGPPDHETVTVRVARRFDADAERVFDAWLNPAQAARFLFKTPDGTMTKVDIDARVGGDYTIVERRGDRDAEHHGEYLEITRPRRLIFTFAVPGFPATRVTVAIADETRGCDLTLTHDGVLAEYAERTKQGWEMILDSLARILAPQ